MNDFEIKKGAWAPEVCLWSLAKGCVCILGTNMGRAHRGQHAQEDVVLVRLVEEHGTKNWSIIAKGIPGRTGKSCRIRCVHCPTPIGVLRGSLGLAYTFAPSQVVQPTCTGPPKGSVHT